MKLRNGGEFFNCAYYKVQPWETFDLNDVQRELRERADQELESGAEPGSYAMIRIGIYRGFNAASECRNLLKDYPGRFLPKDDEATQIYEAVFPELPPPYQEKYREALRLERRHDREQSEG